MEEKKMILVTDGYDDKPICVASNTSAARKSALEYLENQYDGGEYMTTFTMIILIAFVLCLVWQFVAAIERDCIRLEIMFAAEILMFAYLAKTLM